MSVRDGWGVGSPSVTVVPATCLRQQYSGSLNHDIAEHTRGHLRVGPHSLCEKKKKKKYVWVIEGEIWPPRALKRSESMDSAILNREDGSVWVSQRLH